MEFKKMNFAVENFKTCYKMNITKQQCIKTTLQFSASFEKNK